MSTIIINSIITLKNRLRKLVPSFLPIKPSLLFIMTIISLIMLGLIIIVSCSSSLTQDNGVSQFEINEIKYSISNRTITQITGINITKIGVISDPEGNHENTKYFVSEFLKRDVQMIIIPGDIANGFRNNFSDYEETFNVLSAAADSKLPVLIIPGNHERKPVYSKALIDLSKKYSNIIDMYTFRVIDLKALDIVALPGINTPTLTFADGFIYTIDDFRLIQERLSSLNGPIFFVSHNPPAGKGKDDIDVIFNGNNVGDPRIAGFLDANNISFSISGHIHESGGKAVNDKGMIISQNTSTTSMRLNPGSASSWRFVNGTEYNGFGASVEIEGNNAKYFIIKREVNK